MSVVYIQSDNIVSPLGFTTEENFDAVVSGKTGLKYYKENTLEVPEAFCVSYISDEILNTQFAQISNQEVTRFEKMVILSVYNAIEKTTINPSNSRTAFILSTTKGNVDLLEQSNSDERLFLWHSAQVIAKFFKNDNEPLVVSNACISGVTAAIVAKRMLKSGLYDNVIVVGADVVSKFIISGFQSFKALSQEQCKPFDSERVGLNIGEGAATMILGICESENDLPKGTIILENEAITNDANHISGPSRTGEGLFLGIQQVMKNRLVSEIGFINAHGTATPYNDEMESIAITRNGLQSVPTQSLKGYFGHTLGAAGLLELLISAKALQQNIVIKSAGYLNSGVTQPLQIITKTESIDIQRCIKMVSGFGGCNAVSLLKKVC